MNIVSVFDGMACGMIAMILSGIEVDRYVAFEIDKFAVQTSSHNFPSIEHRGDVFEADFTEFKGFDFLVGGSPCTYWSIAQTQNREVIASGLGWELFSQYVRALREIQPKYFIYENNKSMSQAIRDSISETFGFEPIAINSALVSAQSRNRLYWVGIRQADGTYKKANISQPEDRGILLKDVLDTNVFAMRDKARAVISSTGRTTYREYFVKHQGNMVAEPITVLSEKEMDYMVRDHQEQRWSFCNKPAQDEKSKCVVANLRKGVPYNVVAEPMGDNPDPDKGIYEVINGEILVKGKKYPIKLMDGLYRIRKLTVHECMRLQTVPDWYEFPTSNCQAYKMLGNGWTVQVICHLIQGALNDTGESHPEIDDSEQLEGQMNIFDFI